MTTYRSDIDGLRAVAVVPVVLFHGGFTLFSGGYTGVDVFFVISGYLITRIILDELAGGRFTLARFYERRARRILPALFTVMAFTLIAGWFLMLPDAYRDLARSALAALAFVSNIWFWMQSGYFSPSVELMPLLHTWSLAVEEQFYLAVPLLLTGLVRGLAWPRGRIAVLLAVAAAVSFALSVWLSTRYQSVNFYLIPSRAWELALGALLATGAVPAARHRLPRELAAAGGLLLILVPVFAYSRSTVFPGLSALPPCLGASLIIWAGLSAAASPGASPGASPRTDDQITWTARLLSLRPVVFLGLISYSLYLWHWPLLVFARHLTVAPELATPVAASAIQLAAVAAYLSWRFVERPFREGGQTGGQTGGKDGGRLPVRISRAAVTAASLGGAAVLAAASLAIGQAAGVPGRVSPEVRQLAAGAAGYQTFTKAACIDKAPSLPVPPAACLFGRPDQPVRFLLWGDSHAEAIAPAFAVIAERGGVTGAQSMFRVCPALLDAVNADLRTRRRACREHNERTFAYVEQTPSLTTVILTGYWAGYLDGRSRLAAVTATGDASSMLKTGAPDMLKTPEMLKTDDGRLFERSLEQTIIRLRRAGKQVVILDNLPEPGIDVPWTLAMAAKNGRRVLPLPAPEKNDLGERMAAVFKAHGVLEISMDAPICDGPACRLADSGHALFSDSHHVSLYAARSVYAPFIHNHLITLHPFNDYVASPPGIKP